MPAGPMNEEFASYAWTNDLRIARLTRQRFTEQYRRNVLGDRAGWLSANRARVASARTLMRQFGVNGVPALIAGQGAERRLLESPALFVRAEDLIARLQTFTADQRPAAVSSY